MKYPKMDWGTMEAVVNKLGGIEGVGMFLRDELIVSPLPVEIETEVVSVSELGFEAGTTRSNVYNKAVKQGLNPCPISAVQWLLLRHKKQSKNGKLGVATMPEAHPFHSLSTFYTRKVEDNNHTAGGCDIRMDDFLESDLFLIFAKKRK